MNHPTGKALFVDDHGRLWIVTRERDRDGTTAYVLLRVDTVFVDAYRHKYEAVAAANGIKEDSAPLVQGGADLAERRLRQASQSEDPNGPGPTDEQWDRIQGVRAALEPTDSGVE